MNSTIGSLQKAEKEIIIDYELSKVKESLNYLFRNFSSTYKLDKEIAGFNQYEFSYHDGLLITIFSLSLTSVEEEKTKIFLSNVNATGGTSSNAILAGKISDFLEVLSKVLSGVTKEEIKKDIKSNKSCGTTIFLFLVIIVVLYFILK